MVYEFWFQLETLLRQYPALWLMAALVAAWLALAAVILVARRRRLRDVAAALDECTAARFNFGKATRGRLAGDFVPAPEPFAQLHVEFTTRLRDQRAAPAWPQLLLPPQQLVLRGVLPRRPANQLIWMRGRTPERAVGRASLRTQDGRDADLWHTHRLEVLAGEYAVLGENPSVLARDFTDLQMRFGAFTQAVTVQQMAPHVIVALSARGLSAGDLAAVVAMTRTLGRSALRT